MSICTHGRLASVCPICEWYIGIKKFTPPPKPERSGTEQATLIHKLGSVMSVTHYGSTKINGGRSIFDLRLDARELNNLRGAGHPQSPRSYPGTRIRTVQDVLDNWDYLPYIGGLGYGGMVKIARAIEAL